ncbi:MAG: site-2 protease family protein [Kofleriaceae bacterium]
MSTRWRIGTVLGFPVYVHASLVALMAIAFLWFGGVAALLVVTAGFGSVLLHELGHAVVARRRGVAIGAIDLSFLGGAAQMRDLPRSAVDELAIAIAGPVVSIALAAVGFGLGAALGSPLVTGFGWINLVLALFNLLPALPMDGGRVLRALLSLRADYVRATDQAVVVARVVAVGLVALGLTGAYQLLVLAPILWLMGNRERAMARAVAHRFVRTPRGYRERPQAVAPAWFVISSWRAG